MTFEISLKIIALHDRQYMFQIYLLKKDTVGVAIIIYYTIKDDYMLLTSRHFELIEKYHVSLKKTYATRYL